jgi:hypothetical protein
LRPAAEADGCQRRLSPSPSFAIRTSLPFATAGRYLANLSCRVICRIHYIWLFLKLCMAFYSGLPPYTVGFATIRQLSRLTHSLPYISPPRRLLNAVSIPRHTVAPLAKQCHAGCVRPELLPFSFERGPLVPLREMREPNPRTGERK